MQSRRDYNAEYYDAFITSTNDISFYLGFVRSQTAVLELGCGSGRVTAGLVDKAHSIVGVDLSEAMLARARTKRDIGPDVFIQGDITSIRLDQRFDLVIAPFRVFQALEHEAQVDGVFEVIKAHLKPSGLAILNVFHPNKPRDEMALLWPREGETSCGQVELPGGDTLVMSDARHVLNSDRQVLYPELIYRRYRDGLLIDEHVNQICMRYYYPQQFIALIEGHGFSIVDCWGGYDGETYGEGGELVVAFRLE